MRAGPMPKHQGSSPLTRGAHPGGTTRGGRRGLIPAHAGSTLSAHGAAKQGGAHPRSRGEHEHFIPNGKRYEGSSPLTRGAQDTHDGKIYHNGLIPAHAGSTSRWLSSWRAVWAHPRSRGEHAFLHTGRSRLRGSSPLTRGARLFLRRDVVHDGLIPAHAGSTHPAPLHPSTAWAHPRSRGEHHSLDESLVPFWGSSPLTRGALSRMLRNQQTLRAHPRSRGEHVSHSKTPCVCLGSSPLTRGAPSPNCGGGGCPQQRGTTCSPR